MKNLVRGLVLLSLMLISSFVIPVIPQPVWDTQAMASELSAVDSQKSSTQLSSKIDLNNANIIAFQDFKGFYPNLAKMIVLNSPYEKVEDVLEIPELSDRQKELLKAQLDNFEVKTPIMRPGMRMPPRPALRK